MTDTGGTTGGTLLFADAPGGFVLPIIDLSDPRFAVPDDPASFAAQRDIFLAWERGRRRMPRILLRLFLWQAARRSRLIRALFHSGRGFLDSISTYVMKLGPDNLPRGYDSPIDRRVAASPHVVLLRLRMQQIARQLADALTEPLAAQPAAPLHLINIAGGPALDSINAVIFLKRARPDLLRRPIAIHVLDAHADGPAFGANALARLTQNDGPLAGLAIDFRRLAYDWNNPAALAALLATLNAQGAIIAASSEGGLFEYGSDEAIVANLAALAKGGVAIVSGSVAASSDLRKRMIAETGFRIFPRGAEGLAPLAERAGYALARNEPALLSDQVLLRPGADRQP